MELITVIIECPKGSGYKYNYEPDMQCFKLSKVLPAGMVFPFDFGYIPNTIGGDGDPLDVVVISELKSFTGCCMDCRIIGAAKANQTERDGKTVRNDRFLAIPQVSQMFKEINSVDELPEEIVTEIESFFKNYNELAGKNFEVLDRLNAVEALALIKESAE